MNDLETKRGIEDSLKAFGTEALAPAAIALFESLGYNSQKRFPLKPNTPDNFVATFAKEKPLNPDHALLADWQSVDFLFQLTDEEVHAAAQRDQQFLFDSKGKYNGAVVESYLFFAITLTNRPYTRTELSGLTRAVNRLFQMPAMILFRHGNTLTLAVINRRLHKRDESRDVLEKVTLIKDIRFESPHRAHVEILADLSFDSLREKHDFANFVALHAAWQKALDSSELNKRFFQEIANWYFWALDYAEFPKDAPKQNGKDHISVIRLITRLMFCWFVKEKGLIPDTLFDERKLAQILNGFAPTKTNATESVFYKAILQNLFFATLNTEMNARGWTKEEQNFMAHSLYRHRELFQKPTDALGLFNNIPFLNGGLFECLDKDLGESARPRYVRIDGFSRREDSQPVVPDFLFFGTEKEGEEVGLDWQDIYGRRPQNTKVRGLIHTFNHYKFTVAENTPIEEEIALDPELSGRVFENLLAAYNPETGATARKQTGSFYTPREIVNYMVDQALIAYLKTKLEAALPSAKDVEARLRHLFAYNDEPHQFTPQEVDALIAAIDSLKSLDPAVGSGAFPMGILHKLVFILGKLDPRNEKWKERQIARVRDAMSAAEKIEDPTVRERAVHELEQQITGINEAFEHNELDYGRKLYLIENCIYGVDIQPIAVQIAKMRFFISLIVDQKIDDTQPNRGVRPLPNLETKFVAANTLIGVNRPGQQLLRNREIDAKEAKLREVRCSHFLARTLTQKRKCREQDEKLRAEIAQLLKDDGWDKNTATNLASWNPYDQNASANFFDAEWMFGITDGFDIGIGNPPYGAQFTDDEKHLFLRTYHHQDYQLDSYLLFLERGFDFLPKLGVLTFIIPNPWLSNLKLKKIRKFVFGSQTVQEIVHYSRKVFDAVVDTEVVILRKQLPVGITTTIKVVAERDSIHARQVAQAKWAALDGEPVNIFADAAQENLIAKLQSNSVLLKELCDVTVGMKPYQVGKGVPKQTRDIVEGRIFDATHRKDKSYRPLLRGRDIEKYVTKWEGNRWIKYGDHLAEPRPSGGFDASQKIVIRQTGDSLIATLDTEQFICMNNMHTIVSKDGNCDILFILGLLNSKLLNNYFQWLNPEKGEALAEVKKEHVGKLVVKKTTPAQSTAISKRVEKILAAKKTNPAADTSALEREIDQQVYALYGLTPEEIKIVEQASK